MARTVETPRKSGRHIKVTPQVATSPDNLEDETHESEFSEDLEQFSDEDSDYGNCV